MTTYTRQPSFTGFVIRGFALTLLILLAFALTRWFNLEAGRLVDWVIGVVTFWWLLVITTVPWNIHFQARAILSDAADSTAKNIAVQPGHLAYARRWTRWSLVGALVLHVVSAVGLYWVAASGISVIGYLGAGAALLLTGLRPALRGYEYVAFRLMNIGQEVRYPRDDVGSLRTTVEELRDKLQTLEHATDVAVDGSWAAQQQAAHEQTRTSLIQLQTRIQELTALNQAEHRQISRDMEHAIAQLTTDGQVVEHVRELVRFWKNA